MVEMRDSSRALGGPRKPTVILFKSRQFGPVRDTSLQIPSLSQLAVRLVVGFLLGIAHSAVEVIPSRRRCALRRAPVTSPTRQRLQGMKANRRSATTEPVKPGETPHAFDY